MRFFFAPRYPRVSADRPAIDESAEAVAREVLGWPGIGRGAGRGGAITFLYGDGQIGHLHPDRGERGVVDLPVPYGARRDLISSDSAEPHWVGVPGWVTMPLRGPESVFGIVEALRGNYERAGGGRNGGHNGGGNAGARGAAGPGVDEIYRNIDSLPEREGPPPRTGAPFGAHRQLSQNAPREVQERLVRRVADLAGVQVGPSAITGEGSRAFWLVGEDHGGPPEAAIAGGEFAHLHSLEDGSLHVILPREVATSVQEKGWGELHPLARRYGGPAATVMLFGPRDEDELENVFAIVRASYDYAHGDALVAAVSP